MRIFGVDFTSAPQREKPIACASGVLESSTLHIHCLASLANFEVFENFLNSEGPWVAGLDFPFGQPRHLVENLGWPTSWERYVDESESLGMKGFEQVLRDYHEARPSGSEGAWRCVDARAQARTSMTLLRVRVGASFQRGAPFLRHSSVSVLPCRPRLDARVVLEACPALVARRLIGPSAYKSDVHGECSAELTDARRALVKGLVAQTLRDEFDIKIAIDPAMRDELIEEESGDSLDAVLSALQAAWSWTRREDGWGIPQKVDPLEGWIVDPGLAATSQPSTSVRH